MTDEIRCAVSCEEDRTRSGPGRIVGRILTYGERATDRPELFERGALSWPADGVVLNRQHARDKPIMSRYCRRWWATSCASTKRSRTPSRAGTRPRRSAAVSCAVCRCRFRLANSRSRAACAVSRRRQ